MRFACEIPDCERFGNRLFMESVVVFPDTDLAVTRPVHLRLCETHNLRFTQQWDERFSIGRTP